MKKLEDTGINTLIRSIQDMLSNSYENNINEPDVLEELIKCNNLCVKLLNTDYFLDLDEFEDSLKNKDILNKKYRNKWLSLYSKCLNKQSKDLLRLFKLLVRNIEVL